jgi:hypothetical protein
VRAASVDENADDIQYKEDRRAAVGLPRSGRVIQSMITALAAGIGSFYLTLAKLM